MKKIVSLILSCLLLVSPLCVQASSSDGEANYDDLVMPCFAYLTVIRADITKETLGFVTCTSSTNTLNSSVTVVVKCTLQRCKDSGAWTDYKYATETFQGAGEHTVEKLYLAPAGYTYRVKTNVTVKNSSGTTLETASTVSNILVK